MYIQTKDSPGLLGQTIIIYIVPVNVLEKSVRCRECDVQQEYSLLSYDNLSMFHQYSATILRNEICIIVCCTLPVLK